MMITQNPRFSQMMIEHISDTISLLIEEENFFGIMAHIDNITFDPPLPEHIHSGFSPVSYFSFENYTFESLMLHEDSVSFEAGFGEEAIGSVLQVPLSAILQIMIKDMPILINMAQPQKVNDADPYEKSRNMFLSNPKNKKLL